MTPIFTEYRSIRKCFVCSVEMDIMHHNGNGMHLTCLPEYDNNDKNNNLHRVEPYQDDHRHKSKQLGNERDIKAVMPV